MSRHLVLAVTITLFIAVQVQAIGLYSVVGPGTIRSNFKYNVAVSVHKADQPCQIRVGITGPSYNETKVVDVKPMSTENVEFDVPNLASGDYNLTAVGLSGITFENSTRLNFADYKPLVFIQTDKATYKPGDLVQFRVLFLDANTRPLDVKEPIAILINDGAQNLIKQIKDVKLVKGVYSGEFQLSEQPVLGNWNIDVTLDNENAATKSFEVAKYVLPKFEVSVESAKDVAQADGVIKATVRAKYTYGKSVKGKAKVTIKPSYHYYGSSNDNLEAVKTIDVDGKGHVEFDILSKLKDSLSTYYIPPLTILAVVEEELTGNKQNATTTVHVHKERFRIRGIDLPYTYMPEKPIVLKVSIQNLDGSPVQDTKTPVQLIIEPPRSYFYRGVIGESTTARNEKDRVIESHLDENGMATFEFMLPDTDRFYSVKCVFADTTAHLSSLTKYTPNEEVPELLAIKVKTEKPRLGKDIAIEIKSSEKIPYFVYTLVARGNIVMMEHVDVPEGRSSYMIKFTPTFEMVPKATLFVHYIFDGNLRFEESIIRLEKDFENSISISAPVRAKPGEDVELNIKTDPDSFVGLLGVDQSVLLLKSGNDLSKDQIFNSIDNYGTSTPWQRGYGRYPGQISGLVTLTNANYPFNDELLLYADMGEMLNDEPVAMLYDMLREETYATLVAAPDADASVRLRRDFNEIWTWDYVDREPSIIFSPPESYAVVGLPGMPGRSDRPVMPAYALAQSSSSFDAAKKKIASMAIRKVFPENFIFQVIENTDADGFRLSKTIPDTITSWVITGFSLNPKTGLAMTEDPTKIQVFQPFFISTNLPYSVKRGEVIAIPVIIFNYMDKTVDAEVTMHNDDGEFEFTEATNEIEDKPSDDVMRIKRATVPSNSGKTLSFMIRPTKVGLITLKIIAITPLAGDAIHQTLRVEPEGVTQYENRAIFINLAENADEQSENLTIELPKDTVPDSEYIEFSCVGDIFGPTMKNLDQLVRMPYGCGEQNMVNFVPNILVLRYLEATKKELPSVMAKAKRFLEIGYQRELTYKHDDGSYSAFGKSDKEGSTWLTAYVMRSFHQAAKYTDIDPKIMSEGLDFLAAKQADNGSFPEDGKLFDSAHQNDLGLTSFVLLAFLENEEQLAAYQSQMEKGLAYVAENVDATDDQYSLSIAAFALQQAKHPAADKVLAKLQSMAKQDGDRKWWSKEQETRAGNTPWYWRPRSKNVEITSYVLLALLEQNAPEDTLPIIKWLISQRNSNGGFSSTQDTVVGLQALIKFASKTGSGSGTMDIHFTSSGDVSNNDRISVNPENAIVLQTHVLPKSTRQLNFTAKGTGSALVQLSYHYNIADKDQMPSFKVKSTVKDDTPPRQLVVEVCAEYVPLETNDADANSNMAVMEVSLPSGYTADQSSFDKIKSIENVKRAETKNSDTTVIVYFDSLAKGEIKCVPIEAEKIHAVAKQKPAAVSVYDYYDTEKRATEYYEVISSLCDICEGEDCGAGCTPK